jgi:hypothetical protein
MPNVEIAPDVYAALQRRAVPFEDDINDVLRRVLRDDRSSQTHAVAGLNGSAHTLQAIVPVPAPTTDNGHETLPEDANGSGNVIVRRRTPAGDHLPQSTVRTAVLGILKSTGDAVGIADLFRGVEGQLRNRMTDRDLEVLPAGMTRWQCQSRNALTQLEHEGHIERVGEDLYRSRTTNHMTG